MDKHILDLAKELLDYNSETGIFYWKKSTNRRIVVGSEAGWFHDFGYKVITLGRNKIYAHRLAWMWTYGSLSRQIDHINGIPDDNRISNLRECSQSQNLMNYGICSRNTSGVRGVTFDKSRGKWMAFIKAGDTKVQRRFDSKRNAISFRRAVEEMLFGEFLRSAECVHK